MYISHTVSREQVRAQRSSDSIATVVMAAGIGREEDARSNTDDVEAMASGIKNTIQTGIINGSDLARAIQVIDILQ